jgi:hypothetical protein
MFAAINDSEGKIWRRAMSDAVFLLWFVRELEDQEGQDDHEMLIGVYRTENDAKAAVARVVGKPGFVDFPDGFQICRYESNVDHWTEGYVITDIQ